MLISQLGQNSAERQQVINSGRATTEKSIVRREDDSSPGGAGHASPGKSQAELEQVTGERATVPSPVPEVHASALTPGAGGLKGWGWDEGAWALGGARGWSHLIKSNVGSR